MFSDQNYVYSYLSSHVIYIIALIFYIFYNECFYIFENNDSISLYQIRKTLKQMLYS